MSRNCFLCSTFSGTLAHNATLGYIIPQEENDDPGKLIEDYDINTNAIM
jgi:hypothetical protein